MPETRRVGGCQCGAVRYVLTSDPLEVYVCHCRECRKQSSSAFGISVIVRREAFTVTQGETRRWSRGTDSGRTLHCMFCPICGSRVWHEGDGLDTISVKGGTFDEPVDLSHANHIWTSRKLPGVVIPQQAEQFAQEPG